MTARRNVLGRIAIPMIVALVATFRLGTQSIAQDVDTDDWGGIESWSGTINVQVAEKGSMGGPGGISGELHATARGVVNLELAEVRDGPRRLIFAGNDVTFAATYESEAAMPGGKFIAAGSGNSPGGSVKLLINLDDGTYKVSIEDVGEGVDGTGTMVAGGLSQSGPEHFNVGEAAMEATDIELPRSAGALVGTIDLARDHAPMTAGRSGSMSWSLMPCTSGTGDVRLEIDPFQWDVLIFDMDEKPTLVKEAMFQVVSPASADSQIQWVFPAIDGVEMTTEPDDARGSPVTVTYHSLPIENDAFDVGEPVRASVGSGCGGTASDETAARFFFYRDGTGNPDDDEVPNWFYYWLQTAAGQGLSRDQVRYSSVCMRDNHVYGFYVLGTSYIFLCDPAATSSWNTVSGTFTSGIDTYAATILHELAHKKHYDDWWRTFDDAWTVRTGLSRFEDERCDGELCYRPEYLADRYEYDIDRDGIPDDFEPEGMSVYDWDSHDCKMTDEHYLAWLAEDEWANGSANEEDWASPGKQFGFEDEPDDDYEYEPCGTGSP